MDSIISSSPEDTRKIAGHLAKQLEPGAVVLLQGVLGAGKTEFVKGMVESLGGEASQVNSPTFTLIHEYTVVGGVLFHADLYRCEDEQAVLSTGIEECIGAGVCVIEWPEKLGKLAPKKYWLVQIDLCPDGKRAISMNKQSQ